MSQYPALLNKVQLAGPDVVADYHNHNSELNTAGWLVETVKHTDSIIGLYDIHAYPGQAEVRSGKYAELLSEYQSYIPKNKKIVLGEAGYKYWREADSLLMAEYNRRVENHPFTKGSDCNMLVYDYFYGILGSEVFNDSTQEDIRPWFYSWTLMCRFFPSGCDIVKINHPDDKDIFTCAAKYNDKYTIAVINKGENYKNISVRLPVNSNKVSIYRYEDKNLNLDENGFLMPENNGITDTPVLTTLSPLSMVLLTQLN